MNPTDDALAKATAKLDEPEAPAESKAPTTPETTPDSPATPKDTKEGFTAHELDADEESKSEPEIAPANTDGLNAEQKYIVDNLPYISTRIKSGNGTKEVQVKSWTQLPEDVEFASKRDEMAFVNALQAQENRALRLQQTFQQNQQQASNKEFSEREDAQTRDDVDKLQQAGDLPKFKVNINDPKFDDDPAAKQVQSVLDFMEAKNKEYYDAYGKGRPFRHIGFEEAFYMYERNNPSKAPAQKREDAERRELAESLRGNRGLTSREVKRPTIKSGTRIEDILSRIDQEW